LGDGLLAGLTLDAGMPAQEPPGSQLPSGTPRTVRFGVILVQYRGAEGAPATARSKEEASGLARTLAEGARSDFKAAVAKGDPGSTDDAGRIPRGVLEPSAEFTLFTLGPGTVSDPVDTPRGFWILRRIE
jgi:PPIC-type PPIASE domain